jgi:hypothetical protein
MIRLPVVLKVAEAQAIAGPLTRTTTMPGFTYSLDARRCREGSRLRAVAGSTCSKCYALRGWYETRFVVQHAQQLRHAGLDHPRWADAMVTLISKHCRPPDHFFRWHDAGDLQSVDHLRRIVEVCTRTRHVNHWLPTREYADVEAFLRTGGQVPANLIIRLSANEIDAAPDFAPELAHLPTSTTQTEPGRIHNPVAGKTSIVCSAVETRRDTCGRCRACWDPRVTNVSYPLH